MLPTATRPTASRRSLYAGIVVTALAAVALTATTAVLSSATDAVVGVSGTLALSADQADPGQDSRILAAPLLADVQVPPAPAGCPAAAADERAGQLVALQAAQAAELQAVTAAPGTGLAAELGAIRSRAEAAVGRIQQIDASCAAG